MKINIVGWYGSIPSSVKEFTNQIEENLYQFDGTLDEFASKCDCSILIPRIKNKITSENEILIYVSPFNGFGQR